MVRLFAVMGCLSLLVVVCPAARGDEAAEQSAAKAQLAKLQAIVGTWKGVGQPQRSSTKDSWIEEADWAWSFVGGTALVGQLPKGKYFKSIKLTRGDKEGDFELVATPTAGEPIRYAGRLEEGDRLVLKTDQPREGLPERISFRFVAGGDRLLVLLERKSGLSEQFVRLAEVGYTRKGSGFGQGGGGPECVVTGGLGTIAVTFEGKTYYVCCTGCRDYFNDNPAEVLADYQARKAEEKAKKSQ
ncbi:MAG: hypothetical protein SFU86_02535 [Pirellulaceae bacterium]|nr:hypothetical protein [Pirellulaceae bacterium]